MGIIIIVAVIAVPSFRALTGGRSTEAAQNQLSSFIQRARQEAIGVQEIRGVAFITSTDSNLPTAIMVRAVNRPDPALAAPEFSNVEVFLDAVTDRDPMVLPTGVGIQLIDDCTIVPAAAAKTPDPSDDARGNDSYIGMNNYTTNMPAGELFRFEGVILFDAFGRVVANKEYAFVCFRGTQFTEIANLFHMKLLNQHAFRPGKPNTNPGGASTPPPVTSAVGFVLYDQDGFANLGYTDRDPQCDSTLPVYGDVPEATWQSSQTGRSDEALEERWLDANAVPIIVNRANGTLIRGQ
jgi:type II secretory pathway pseudopilin PulG